MMEPRRLTEQGATGAELALLRSARMDEPSAGAAERILVAIEGTAAGIGALSAYGSSSASGGSSAITGTSVAAPTMKLGVLAKVSLFALVGAGVVGGGALVYYSHRSTARGSAPVESAGPQATPAGRTPAIAPETSPGEAPRPMSASKTEHMDRSPAVAGRPRRSNPVVDESLRAETRALDLARAAVDARDPFVAQHALEDYARRFPQGHLRPEAAVLRLEVLVQEGNRRAARSLGGKLLANRSFNAYEQRIRSLLRDLGD